MKRKWLKTILTCAAVLVAFYFGGWCFWLMTYPNDFIFGIGMLLLVTSVFGLIAVLRKIWRKKAHAENSHAVGSDRNS
jgi:hypothetical protein